MKSIKINLLFLGLLFFMQGIDATEEVAVDQETVSKKQELLYWLNPNRDNDPALKAIRAEINANRAAWENTPSADEQWARAKELQTMDSEIIKAAYIKKYGAEKGLDRFRWENFSSEYYFKTVAFFGSVGAFAAPALTSIIAMILHTPLKESPRLEISRDFKTATFKEGKIFIIGPDYKSVMNYSNMKQQIFNQLHPECADSQNDDYKILTDFPSDSPSQKDKEVNTLLGYGMSYLRGDQQKSLDTKAKSLDTKVKSLDTKVKSLDEKYPHLAPID